MSQESMSCKIFKQESDDLSIKQRIRFLRRFRWNLTGLEDLLCHSNDEVMMKEGL